MHRARLIIVGVVSAAIGFVAVVARNPEKVKSSPEPLLHQPASAITFIHTPSGEAHRTGPERWRVTLSAHPENIIWSGDATRLRSLTRLLAAATTERAEIVRPGGPTASIGLGEHGEVHLRFDPAPLAGSVGVELEGPLGTRLSRMEYETARLLTQGGTSWLSFSAFPELPVLPAEPARVELISGNDRIVLDRLGSRWVLRHPVSEDADLTQVRLVLRQVAALAGERMIPSEELAETAPIGELRVWDTRSQGRQWIVEVFPSPDPERVYLRCRVVDSNQRVVLGPIGMAAERSLIDRIGMDPMLYTSRRVLRGASTDLEALIIQSERGRWEFVRTEASWQSATGDASHGANSLARLLTLPNASLVLRSESSHMTFTEYFVLELLDETVDPLPNPIRIGIYTPAGGVARFAIETRGILRVYETSDAQPVWEWLLSLQEDD